jgi:crotonobetainyl-CoA:carnitine CoA-transferase CaiB-like acyl-CoA transferase
MTPLPLEGVRVLDFCVVWAGPFGTMLLGDLGAEVIKVENPFVMQPMTRGTRAHPDPASIQAPAPAGAWPGNDLGPRPWNYTTTFVNVYRNKKSVTMDLRRPEGMELLARLVAQSDVIYENNASETLPKLGITYDWLRSIREDIIMLRAPAYGSSGAYENARALGVHLESVMGHTLLRGFADHAPTETTPIYSGDYMAGTQGALAVMMALWHRRRTGEGQLIELSQAENAAGILAQAFMDHAINGRATERRGNDSYYDAVPYGVYPCRSPGTAETGDDRWISISVLSDDQWSALAGAMGEPVWATPDLEELAGRQARRDEIDRELAAWTAQFDDYELFHRLQAAGVPAAPVLEASRVHDDAQIQARGLFQHQDLWDDIGRYRYLSPFLRFSETPLTVRQPPVAMGEHNEYVYKQLLGVDDDEYARLEAEGHIAMDFDPSVP